MKKISFNIPDTIDNTEASMLFASKLYESGKLSLGQAAEVAGLSKRTFMELLGKYGVSVFNYPASDLEKDLEHAKRHNIRQ
ncbi:MAG: UPF0175 family protein [Ignavibacteriaceae bacterium]